MARYFGHPDNDHPDFHLADRPVGPAPKRLSREELRRLEEQLAEIDRAARGKKA